MVLHPPTEVGGVGASDVFEGPPSEDGGIKWRTKSNSFDAPRQALGLRPRVDCDFKLQVSRTRFYQEGGVRHGTLFNSARCSLWRRP